ncbi:methyl-accepting chemotaxis protein [uncultured Roseobacter sp.]|uniref:methyl-accepting chemotaxis protein n=1 Tax=uncultured Roseobacter sp. TaxID=114847 RepID=UPI00262E1CB4|nr:methyl-accepting chemotaxis protein [uncultured Roseobacter sp.]
MNNLLVKTSVIVIVCVVTVVSVIAILNRNINAELMAENMSQRASETTNLLAMQMGGSIKFGNTAGVAQIVDGVIASAKPDAIGALVLSATGTVMYNEGDEAFDSEAATALAERALESGQRLLSDDGLSAAEPATFGDAAEIAGIVVTSWSDASLLAALEARQTQALIMGMVVMAVAVLLSGIFLRTQMSRPLIRLTSTMSEIENANYSIDVPYTGRGDEVGQMARRLDTFREALGVAKEAERESAFKSAAFVGSTAPMMMVDEKLRVIFVNPTCEALLQKINADLQKSWPDLADGTVEGADLSKFAELTDEAGRVLAEGMRALPISHQCKIGDALISINMNAALNEAGEMIGAVIEWSDETDAARNAALLNTIDNTQMRVEFDADGRVVATNGNMSGILRTAEEVIEGRSFGDIFTSDVDGEMSEADLYKRVFTSEIGAEAIAGRFNVQRTSGGSGLVLEGNFASVPGLDGTLERVIFLGTDVTDNAAALKDAEEERRRVAEQQKSVVSALGVALQDLADGDLTCEIDTAFPTDYEKLRADFNAAVQSLQEAVGAVTQNADQIRNETGEITSAADDLSRRTEKQAATLEETAAALDELTSSVKSAAEGADEASAMSAEAQANAEEGGDIARKAVEAMDGIKTSSQEISKITTVIDDIAFQTNLLALNAGVEAARAGEAGRGFAVVATEVRALAQRSSDAAREINALISSSGEQVGTGVELVDKTGQALASIVNSVSEISKRVSTIAASSREQSTGLNEINTAVNELDHVTQQNAAMFEETTAASHALTAEADALAAAVARFKLDTSGASQTTATAKPASEASVTEDPKVDQSPAAPAPRAATQGNAALKVEADDAPDLDDGWDEF